MGDAKKLFRKRGRITTAIIIGDAAERYAGAVYRLAYSRTGNRPDADDVTQEVFLRLVKNSGKIQDEEHLKAWLIRATLNRCNSLARSAWRRHTAPLPDDIPYEDGESRDVSRCVAALPQNYRAVIHLFYYEDLPVAEIAALMRARESTVRTWLTRARAMLRQSLREEYDDL